MHCLIYHLLIYVQLLGLFHAESILTSSTCDGAIVCQYLRHDLVQIGKDLTKIYHYILHCKVLTICIFSLCTRLNRMLALSNSQFILGFGISTI